MARSKKSRPVDGQNRPSAEAAIETAVGTNSGSADLPEQELQERVKSLIEQLSVAERDKRGAAIEALAAIGEPAVSSLTEALASEDHFTRGNAAAALGYMGTEIVTAPRPLIELLVDDTDSENRLLAAWALGNIKDRAAAAALRAALRDVAPRVREQAAYALGQLRDAAAVPVLIQALRDLEPRVRELAAFALALLRDAAAVPALIEAMSDAVPDVRVQAVWALGEIKEPAAAMALREALHDSDWGVRARAAAALGEIKDAQAVPALIEALQVEDSMVASTAAATLHRLGVGSIPSLIDALAHPHHQTRALAANVLKRFGAQAKAAIPALIQALQDPNQDVRIKAAEVFGAIGEDARAALPTIEKLRKKEGMNLIGLALAEAEVAIEGHSRGNLLEGRFPYGSIEREGDNFPGRRPGLPGELEPEPQKHEEPLPPPTPNQELERTQAAFDKLVEEIAAERERQAVKLQPVLNEYLLRWDEHQQALEEAAKASQQKRPQAEVFQQKHKLAEHVSNRLERLGFAIAYKEQPTDLMAQTNKRTPRGWFLLMPKGSRTPLLTKANLTDILREAGQPDRPGFELVQAPLRREPLREWLERIRRNTPQQHALQR